MELLAPIRLFLYRGDEHAVGLQPHHLPGRQIGAGHHGLAHQFLRLIVFVDAGEDLPGRRFAAVQRKAQQLLALLHRLAGEDLGGDKPHLAKIVDGDILRGRFFRGSGGLGSFFQLLQLLFQVDAGEQVLPLGNGRVRGQQAPPGGGVPGTRLRGRADLCEDLCAGLGHERGQEDGGDTHALQQVV